MPVLDGFQAAQKIRARPNGSNTKIIALSANAFVTAVPAVIKYNNNN